MNIKFLYIFCSCLILSLSVYCQADKEPVDPSEKDTISVDDPDITVYEKLNTVIGGDSVRYCDKQKCSGWIVDYYPNGKMKHRGYYANGQLTSVYKNYYDTGELERSFKVKDEWKCILTAYYKSGKLKSEVHYYNGEPVKWEDFYPDGKPEMSEEYDKDFDHYLKRTYYYKNGNLQSTLELKDKKNLTYTGKEYYYNGQVHEEGNLEFNKKIRDYQKVDDWKVYSDNGKLITEQYYENGVLDREKTF